VPSDSAPPPPGGNRRRPPLLLLAGPAACLLALAYSPPLRDALESLVFVQPPPAPPPLPSTPDVAFDAPAVQQPPALPAQKAALDEDTPVVGVVAGGRARAYLVEAFEHGPASHVVNDAIGEVPVSVTHCDISGCTRVFTGAAAGGVPDLSCGGVRGYRLVLKSDGHLYRQDTGESLDEGGPPFPYGAYPAEVTQWGAWRQAHPGTDVYMGAVDEATPPEARQAVRIHPSQAAALDASP